MLPMGLKLNDFVKVNKLIFTNIPFNIDEEMIRDNKIFGMKLDIKKISLKNKNNNNRSTKKKKTIL
jgi:hypothetical protein